MMLNGLCWATSEASCRPRRSPRLLLRGGRMFRLLVSGLVMVVALAGAADAQNTSQVFGKATDASGAVLPGVTVTLSSPALLEPRIAITSDTGTYEFSGLPIGVYSVKFELTGFATSVREGLQLRGGIQRAGQRRTRRRRPPGKCRGDGCESDCGRPQHHARHALQRRGTGSHSVRPRRVPGADTDAGHHRGSAERRRHPQRPADRHVLARRRQRAGTVVRRRRRSQRHRQWPSVCRRLQLG